MAIRRCLVDNPGPPRWVRSSHPRGTRATCTRKATPTRRRCDPQQEANLAPCPFLGSRVLDLRGGQRAGGVEAVCADENVWLSQNMMAQLDEVELPIINYHLKGVRRQRARGELSYSKFSNNCLRGKVFETKLPHHRRGLTMSTPSVPCSVANGPRSSARLRERAVSEPGERVALGTPGDAGSRRTRRDRAGLRRGDGPCAASTPSSMRA